MLVSFGVPLVVASITHFLQHKNSGWLVMVTEAIGLLIGLTLILVALVSVRRVAERREADERTAERERLFLNETVLCPNCGEAVRNKDLWIIPPANSRTVGCIRCFGRFKRRGPVIGVDMRVYPEKCRGDVN
jgi:hypothetical protein